MNELKDLKAPPQDGQAETAVLGSMMLSEQALITCHEILSPLDFYSEVNRGIYRAICSLYSKREPADVRTVTDELKKVKEFRDDTISKLASIVGGEFIPSNAEFYAQIVKEKAKLRHLITDCTLAIAEAYSEATPPEEITEGLVNKLVLTDKNQEAPSSNDAAMKIFEDSVDKKTDLMIPTGFDGFDRQIRGIRRGVYATVTGESEAGKSTFVQNVCLNVARMQKPGTKERYKVSYLYLDGKWQDLPKRQICMMNKWHLADLESNDLTIHPSEKRLHASAKWGELGIRVADKNHCRPDWAKVRLWIMRECKKHGTDFLVIDGGERIKFHPKFGENYYTTQATVISELEDLAGDLNIGLWVIVGQAKSGKGKFKTVDDDEEGSNAWRKFASLRLKVERTERPFEAKVKVTKNRYGGKFSWLFEGTEDTFKWLETEAASERE